MSNLEEINLCLNTLIDNPENADIHYNEINLIISKILIEKNGLNIKHIKKDYLNDKLYELAIKNSNGMAIQYIEHNNKTFDLCKLAVETNGLSLKYIKKIFQDKELFIIIEKAIMQNPHSIQYIDINYYIINKKIMDGFIKNALRIDGTTLQYVPHSKEFYPIAIHNNGLALEFILENLSTDLIEYNNNIEFYSLIFKSAILKNLEAYKFINQYYEF